MSNWVSDSLSWVIIFSWKVAMTVSSGVTEGSLSNFLAWLQFEINLIISCLSQTKATNSVSLWPSDVRSLLFQFPSQLRFDSTSWRALVLLSYSCEILKKNLGSISFCNKQLTWSSEYKMFNLISNKDEVGFKCKVCWDNLWILYLGY